VLQLAYLFYLRKQEQLADRAWGGRYWLILLIVSGMVSAAAVFFIPSGVLLWSVTFTWLQVAVGWLITIDLRREQQLAVPARDTGEPEPGAVDPDAPEPPNPEDREDQLPGPPVEEQDEGTGVVEPVEPSVEPVVEPAAAEYPVVFQASAPVSSLVALHGGGFAVLEEGGRLTRVRDGEEVSGPARVAEPIGLAPTAEGRVAIVDAKGRIAVYAFTGEGVEQARACVTGPTTCFAANRYGTQVAYAGETPGVSSWVVADERTREVLPDLTDVRSIAYSHGGSRLWAVTGAGRLVCADLKGGSTTESDLPEGGTAVASQPNGVIVVAADRLVSVADDASGAVWRLSGAATSLATHPIDGRVAVGSSKGYVRVRSADLAQTLFEGKVHASGVVALAFDGDDVIAAARDGSIRRVQP
jgi:hypothetical protein